MKTFHLSRLKTACTALLLWCAAGFPAFSATAYAPRSVYSPSGNHYLVSIPACRNKTDGFTAVFTAAGQQVFRTDLYFPNGDLYLADDGNTFVHLAAYGDSLAETWYLTQYGAKGVQKTVTLFTAPLKSRGNGLFKTTLKSQRRENGQLTVWSETDRYTVQLADLSVDKKQRDPQERLPGWEWIGNKSAIDSLCDIRQLRIGETGIRRYVADGLHTQTAAGIEHARKVVRLTVIVQPDGTVQEFVVEGITISRSLSPPEPGESGIHVEEPDAALTAAVTKLLLAARPETATIPKGVPYWWYSGEIYLR